MLHSDRYTYILFFFLFIIFFLFAISCGISFLFLFFFIVFVIVCSFCFDSKAKYSRAHSIFVVYIIRLVAFDATFKLFWCFISRLLISSRCSFWVSLILLSFIIIIFFFLFIFCFSFWFYMNSLYLSWLYWCY